MSEMGTAPAHAKPVRRDHLWVLAVIAICALFEVWVSWVTIGSMSGFPKIGGDHGLPTAWTLAVTSEAYWGYALYAWLAGAPGPRSRRFAMWSFAVVFVLSLIGQAASHLVPQGTVPPPAVVVFITSLPVIVLALIAVLVHLRQLDREDAAKTEQRDEKDAEIAILRAELDGERQAQQPIRDALAAAQKQAEEDAQERATLERKLAAQTAARKRANSPRAKSTAARARQAQEQDVDARTKALSILAAEPDISGAKLAERVGMSKRWGQLHKPELAAMAADLEE